MIFFRPFFYDCTCTCMTHSVWMPGEWNDTQCTFPVPPLAGVSTFHLCKWTLSSYDLNVSHAPYTLHIHRTSFT